MNFKKLFLFFAMATLAAQSYAMENQNPKKPLSLWQKVSCYKYPLLVGAAVFTSGTAYSYIKDTLSENLMKIASGSLATTMSAMSIQLLCESFFNKTEIDKENKDSVSSQTQENRGSVVINEKGEDTKNDVSNPDLEPDIIGLIKLDLSRGVTSTANKLAIAQKICAEYSGVQQDTLLANVKRFHTALQAKVKNARAICTALNTIGGIISPNKAIIWNKTYETGYAQLREWLEEDIAAIKHNKPVLHEQYIYNLCIMQNHPQLKYITILYDQIKSDQRYPEKSMQWLFDHPTTGFNAYFGWNIIFGWPKRFWFF